MALTQWLQQSRRGGGEFNTPNMTVPAGIDEVRVQLDVLPADFAAPDLSVTATVEVSTDNAQTWIHQGSYGWVGGPQPLGPGGVRPWAGGLSGISAYAGFLVRVHFSTSGTFRWGLLGELR